MASAMPMTLTNTGTPSSAPRMRRLRPLRRVFTSEFTLAQFTQIARAAQSDAFRCVAQPPSVECLPGRIQRGGDPVSRKGEPDR